MKLTELRCTACNGTLKLDEKNPNMAVCEYCKSRYVLEDEGSGNVRLAEEPMKRNYVPVYNPAPKKAGRSYGWKGGAALAAGCILLMASALIINIQKDLVRDTRRPAAASFAYETDTGTGEPEGKKEALTGIFGDMAAAVSGKPADSLSDEELAAFKWLEYRYSGDYIMVGYSFDDPGEDPQAFLTWLEFPRDNADLNMKALTRFHGLKALNVANYLNPQEIEGLELESLGCYSETPAEVAAGLENPGGLKSLSITGGLRSLEGLGEFSGLERLEVGGSYLTDIKPLANMKSLKSLTLTYCHEVTDFSVLYVMDGLEELSVESEGIRDIGFVKNMPSLRSFALSRGELLNLDPLEGAPALTSLTIESCGELKDMNSVSGLTGLESLSLEVPYGCEKPDLRGLTNLRTLDLSGMDTVGYLPGMTALEKLSLKRVTIDSPASFSGLGNLRHLKCSYISSDTSWNFVTSVPALEIVELTGVATYKDISGLFGMPALKELYLNGVECELDFSKLTPSQTLERLEMDGMKLYKNVQISGGGGIVYVDYDKVNLNEHLDFLANYPGLKSLSLADNQLTGLEFVSGLMNLERLDISGNYVTDLKPLTALEKLNVLECKGNPVENYRVLGENVTIIQ